MRWLSYALWLAVVVAATAYAAGWPTDNRVARWVGQLGDDEGWRLLVEHFGGDEHVLTRVEGVELGSGPERAALAELRRELAAEPAVARCVDALALVTPIEALDLVDVEGTRYDFLLAIRVDATSPERVRLVRTLARLRETVGERGWTLRSAGHPLVAAALDGEARAVERRFAPALGLLAALATALFLRSWLLALAVLLPAGCASAVPRAVLRGMGIDSDLLLVALGPLGFVLLLASTLHLATAYARHRRRLAVGEARRAAVREKLAAGLLAAGTTGVGFGVFLASELRSVATLGAAVALTMLVGVPLVFLFVPPLFGAFEVSGAEGPTVRRPPWRAVALGSLRRRGTVAALAVAVLALGAWSGLTLPTETNPLDYFPAGHPAREDFLTIEERGTGLSTVDVLVARPGEERWSASELLASGLADALSGVAEVNGVVGPEAFASLAGRAGPLDPLAVLALAQRVDGERRWARWTVRFPTADAGPTRDLVERVRATVAAWKGDRPLEVHVAGSVPAMLAMQDELVATLASSLALTVLVTTLCFALVARRARALIAALVTNLFPVAAALGAARLLGIPLDSATVMVAAVVLGLAVDNTFHLLHAAGGGTTRARLRAFDRVGQAACASSLALALGFGALALSGFAPTARFGLLCAIGALAALVADLLVLPALWIRPSRAALPTRRGCSALARGPE